MFSKYLRILGKNIRSARARAGMKQIDVYAQSGITYRHYQSIEAGRVNVSIETLYRLAKLYRTTIEELVREP